MNICGNEPILKAELRAGRALRSIKLIAGNTARPRFARCASAFLFALIFSFAAPADDLPDTVSVPDAVSAPADDTPDAVSVPADDVPDTRIVLVGDSIMRTLSHTLKRELSARPGVSVFSFSYLRPALSRLDNFDWFDRIEKILKVTNPDVAVIMMGVNDKQPMQVTSQNTSADDPEAVDENAPVNGVRVIQPDSPEWNTEYARRVGTVMDLMIEGGVEKIFWIELPDMLDPKLQEDTILINSLIRSEVETRPEVTFLQSKPLLSRMPGTYSRYIYDADGMPMHVRAAEGVNLNENGADILTEEIISRIFENEGDDAP